MASRICYFIHILYWTCCTKSAQKVYVLLLTWWSGWACSGRWAAPATWRARWPRGGGPPRGTWSSRPDPWLETGKKKISYFQALKFSQHGHLAILQLKSLSPIANRVLQKKMRPPSSHLATSYFTPLGPKNTMQTILSVTVLCCTS